MKKKIFALLLSAVLCVGVVGSAFAATPGLVPDGDDGVKLGNMDEFAQPTPPPTTPPGPVVPIDPVGPTGPSTPSYNVTNGTGTSDDGSWSTDKTSAKKGDTVVITVTPKDGYAGTPTVKDKNGNVVAVTDLGSGKWSFTMPDGAVTVSVAFTPAVPVNPFTDVQPGPYYDAILWAVKNGITAGTSATTFSPNRGCTRAQIVTFLYRAAGKPELSSDDNPFTDIQPGDYYDAILWAVDKGITAGTGDGTTFSPSQVCTRAQAVTFLWRAAGEPEPASQTSPFTDVQDTNAFYYKAVLWAVEKGITTGTTSTTFSPNNTCTRGQIVTFLYRDMV